MTDDEEVDTLYVRSHGPGWGMTEKERQKRNAEKRTYERTHGPTQCGRTTEQINKDLETAKRRKKKVVR